KGNQSLYVTIGNNLEGGKNQLIDFEAGMRENMVPQDAKVVFISQEVEKIKTTWKTFIEANPITGSFSVEGKTVTIEAVGKSAHGMNPAAGVNAATYLAVFLNQFEFGGEAATYFKLITDYIHLDFAARDLGVAHTDAIMGELT